MIHSFKSIFVAYGGWHSLRTSSYLKLAVFLTILSYGYIPEARWTKLAQSIFPNLIGFSIAAIAIITVIGDDGFRKKMAKISTINRQGSDMVSIMASFIWFIWIQMTALIISIIIEARSFDACDMFSISYCKEINSSLNLIFSSVGLLIFFYGITLVLSSAFLTFDAFRLYIRTQQK
jgi:hypothetical protein